jgi:hypothetical protein
MMAFGILSPTVANAAGQMTDASRDFTVIAPNVLAGT